MTEIKAEHSVDFWADLLRKEKWINDDDTENEFPLLVLIGALENGVDMGRVRTWLGKRAVNHLRLLKTYWQRAIENHIFVGDKIACVHPKIGPDSCEIILWAMTLRGLVRRVPTK